MNSSSLTGNSCIFATLCRGDCLRPYNSLRSLQTLSDVMSDFKPSGIAMKISSFKSPFRNAVTTSICSSSKFRCVTIERIVRIVPSVSTGAYVSLQSALYICRQPKATNRTQGLLFFTLKTYLHGKTFIPVRNLQSPKYDFGLNNHVPVQCLVAVSQSFLGKVATVVLKQHFELQLRPLFLFWHYLHLIPCQINCQIYSDTI